MKIFDGVGLSTILFLIAFFLIGPGDIKEAEVNTYHLSIKSMELDKRIDSLNSEIILLQNQQEERRIIIKDILNFLETKKAKKNKKNMFETN